MPSTHTLLDDLPLSQPLASCVSRRRPRSCPRCWRGASRLTGVCMADFWKRSKFDLSSEVRHVVLDILTTYRGPYTQQVSAPMLGMKREAVIACGLLDPAGVVTADREEMRHLSLDIRSGALELLTIIRDLLSSRHRRRLLSH